MDEEATGVKKEEPRKKHRNSFIRGRFKPLKKLVKESLKNIKSKKKTPKSETSYEVDVIVHPPVRSLTYKLDQVVPKFAEILNETRKTFSQHILQKSHVVFGKIRFSSTNPDFKKFFEIYPPFKRLSTQNLKNNMQNIDQDLMGFTNNLDNFQNLCIQFLTRMKDSLNQESVLPVNVRIDLPECLQLISETKNRVAAIVHDSYLDTKQKIDMKISMLENLQQTKEIMYIPRKPLKNAPLVHLVRSLIECSGG